MEAGLAGRLGQSAQQRVEEDITWEPAPAPILHQLTEEIFVLACTLKKPSATRSRVQVQQISTGSLCMPQHIIYSWVT